MSIIIHQETLLRIPLKYKRQNEIILLIKKIHLKETKTNHREIFKNTNYEKVLRRSGGDF